MEEKTLETGKQRMKRRAIDLTYFLMVGLILLGFWKLGSIVAAHNAMESRILQILDAQIQNQQPQQQMVPQAPPPQPQQ